VPLPPFFSLQERLIMQVELVGGPKDGAVIGIPDKDRKIIRFPYMTDPVYISWTAKEELTPQEVDLSAHEYIVTNRFGAKGLRQYIYVKGT
jgi:hypothetical protein